MNHGVFTAPIVGAHIIMTTGKDQAVLAIRVSPCVVFFICEPVDRDDMRIFDRNPKTCDGAAQFWSCPVKPDKRINLDSRSFRQCCAIYCSDCTAQLVNRSPFRV
jgi:hypothetical protein